MISNNIAIFFSKHENLIIFRNKIRVQPKRIHFQFNEHKNLSDNLFEFFLISIRNRKSFVHLKLVESSSLPNLKILSIEFKPNDTSLSFADSTWYQQNHSMSRTKSQHKLEQIKRLTYSLLLQTHHHMVRIIFNLGHSSSLMTHKCWLVSSKDIFCLNI